MGLRRFFAGRASLDVDDLERLAASVEKAGGPVAREELQDGGVTASVVAGGTRRLEDVGAVEVLPDGDVAPGPELGDARDAARAAVRAPTSGRRSGTALASR